MSKLSYGVPNKHVLQSKGGDSNIMKFYCTQNQTTYGQKFAKFQPRKGKHTGTGYLSNFRPGVYYSQRLDDLDNPTMGKIVAGNYQSMTHKQFKPYKESTGKEPLPNQTVQIGSGFVREAPLTIPTVKDVYSVAIDTRVASAPADYLPRGKPHLHKIQSKDPVEQENAGYGPGYMTTESSQRFKGRQLEPLPSWQKTVGYKEGSGFTHAYNVEPVTFHPDYAHRNDAPAQFTDRPTGVSIMTTHYRPTIFNRGDEALPKLATRSDRNTGFTSGTKPRAEFVNPELYPDNPKSVTKDTYLGKQWPDKSDADRLGRTGVGLKEDTGFTENNDRFIQTSDNPARFITHYDTRFIDRNPRGIDREGHTWGGVQQHKQDGFTRSTNIHDFGEEVNSTASLRNLEPYVSRSIKARDVFYDDHKYDSKVHTMVQRSTTAVF